MKFKHVISLVVFIGITIFGVLCIQFKDDRHHLILTEKNKFIETIFLKKKMEIERITSLTYQSLRTISLLPSVRQITGRNRINENENVIKDNRFSKEGALTVQQLFNNLKSNVNVSEIYAVLDGFDPSKSEVPFFMYDEMKLIASESEAKEPAKQNADTPEEYEVDEYNYFVTMLREWKSRNFQLSESTPLNEIPAMTSHLIRTCDNEQYTSLKNGDVNNTLGIVYSVPFYGFDGKFKGAIIAVIRANVIEAALMDVPKVVVTEADMSEYKEKKWTIKEKPIPFMVVNQDRSLIISDRRYFQQNDTKWSLGDKNKVFESLRSNDKSDMIYFEEINFNDGLKWNLVYDFSQKPWEDLLNNLVISFLFKIIFLFLIVGSVLFYYIISLKKLKNIANKLNSEIGVVSSKISEAGGEALENGRKLSEISTSLSAVSSQLASAINQIESQTRNNSEQAKLVKNLSEGMHSEMEISQQSINELRSSMNTILESTERVNNLVNSIQQIRHRTEFIEDIVFKTELLSFNASIEAARAGEHGAGFSVVSEQVAALAGAIKKAASEISELTQKSLHDAQSVAKDNQERVLQGNGSVHKVSKLVEHVGNLSQQIATSMTSIADSVVQQLAGVHQISKTTERIQSVTLENKVLADESLKLGGDLSEHTQTQNKSLQDILKNLVA